MKIADDPAAPGPVIEYQPCWRSTKSRLPGGAYGSATPSTVMVPLLVHVVPPSSLAHEVMFVGVFGVTESGTRADRARTALASMNATVRICSAPTAGVETVQRNTPRVVCKMAPSDCLWAHPTNDVAMWRLTIPGDSIGVTVDVGAAVALWCTDGDAVGLGAAHAVTTKATTPLTRKASVIPLQRGPPGPVSFRSKRRRSSGRPPRLPRPPSRLQRSSRPPQAGSRRCREAWCRPHRATPCRRCERTRRTGR